MNNPLDAVHPAVTLGWTALGGLGAALPLLRKGSRRMPTRHLHLVMCAVMLTAMLPGVSWWFSTIGILAIACATGQMFSAAHDSPECVSCLVDAVAMGLMLGVVVIIGMTSTGTAGMHGFPLLGCQVGIAWAVAALWSRRRRAAPVGCEEGGAAIAHRRTALKQPGGGGAESFREVQGGAGQPGRPWRSASFVGSALMAGSMTAMMIGPM